MKRKLIAAVVLLAVGVGATGYALFAPSAGAAATTQYLTSVATTGDVTREAAAPSRPAPPGVSGSAALPPSSRPAPPAPGLPPAAPGPSRTSRSRSVTG